MSDARRHVSFHIAGGAEHELDVWRERWDPVMAARTPPHVTVVYPEEAVDEQLVLDRLEQIAAEMRPFDVDLGEVRADDNGVGGVYVDVADRSGALETIRDRLLLPPQRYRGHPFHSTIAHPRTSTDPAGCWSELRGRRLDRNVRVNELLHTITDHDGRRVLARYPLRGDGDSHRTVYAGAVVVRDDRVLLGLRAAGRAEFPAVWDLPGGHVEAGESPRRALVRELREELAIEAAVGAPWHRLVDQRLAVEVNIWMVLTWEGDLVNAAPDEHSELRWCDARDLTELRLAHPALRTLALEALDGAARTSITPG